jgi:F420-dependent oxidoreductase-like protein
MKLSIQYPELAAPALAHELVRAADRLGYETVWVTESYGFDSVSTLGYLAAITERIKLGTGIVNVYSRSPALLAQSAVTLDALSGGRVVLGLGTSGRAVVTDWHGAPFEWPLQRLRESVEVIRMAIRRERLVYEGEVFHLRKGIKLLTTPVRSSIPIYLASISPGGLALAGELADGVLPVHVSLRHAERLLVDRIAVGAARVPRDPAACKLCAFGVPVIPTADRKAALDLERPRIALYVGGMGTREHNFYKDLFVRYGYEEEAERIQELYLARRREEAIAVVTDEMVDEVSVIGPIEECRRRLQAYEQAGFDEVVMLLELPGGEPEGLFAALEALAPG